MTGNFFDDYKQIRNGGSGFYEHRRGLIAVWGKEAIQFLDGLISNDFKTLKEGGQMMAAFPNAQGRLLAVVRVLRQGDRFLLETEDATREKVFKNLFRFTFAGDFFVEDLSEDFKYFEIFGGESEQAATATGILYGSDSSASHFIEAAMAERFRGGLIAKGAVEINDELYETLRIENGTPRYGVDMDETTIVPELGLEGLVSYKKGCYIGQEIIARIHFRGHVAKRLTGLIFEGARTSVSAALADTEISVPADGKNAGRITSVTDSPQLDKTIALAFVRYNYLAEGTELNVGNEKAVVTRLPFMQQPQMHE